MAFESTSATERFERLLEAIESWLDRVVIVGGWTLPLLRHHPFAQALPYSPIYTKDADVAVPLQLRSHSGDVRERLLARGFHGDLIGDDKPPVTHYRFGDDAGFYAEFPMTLDGGEFKRDVTRDVTVTIAGVTAQKLRHLNILFIEPWTVSLPRVKNAGEPFNVRVANPVSYIIQKLLVHAKRKRDEQAKDVLYRHDTIELFAASLNDLQSVWNERVSPALEKRARAKVREEIARLFGEVTDQARNAAFMAAGRQLSPEALVHTCNAGFRRLFG